MADDNAVGTGYKKRGTPRWSAPLFVNVLRGLLSLSESHDEQHANFVIAVFLCLVVRVVPPRVHPIGVMNENGKHVGELGAQLHREAPVRPALVFGRADHVVFARHVENIEGRLQPGVPVYIIMTKSSK